LTIVGWVSKHSLPANLLIGFRTWIEKQPLCDSTKHGIFLVVRKLVLSLARNFPAVIAPGLRISRKAFDKTPAVGRTLLGAEDVKAILKCCYDEIEKVEIRLSKRLPIDAQGRFLLGPGNSVLDHVIARFGGRIPIQTELCRAGLGSEVRSHGGLLALTQSQWVSPADVFPFYLAVLIQSAGNPMALLLMPRNCIKPNPLRGDLEFLDWYKPRAKREQRVDFPKDKAWSAPNVVRRLLSLNANLVAHARVEDSNKAFLTMVNRDVRIPSSTRLLALLHLFIAKHALPEFTFRDCRASSGELHRTAVGNLEASQLRLNHQSADTTLLYVDRSKMHAECDQSIHHFQGQIVYEAITKVADPCKPGIASDAHNDTVFGFACRSPLEGIAPGSKAGELCENFSHCAQCPGALVPLDNPRIVARLLTAAKALELTKCRAKSEGWMQRFNALYSVPLHVLLVELLPRVSDATRAQALPLMLGQAVPFLE